MMLWILPFDAGILARLQRGGLYVAHLTQEGVYTAVDDVVSDVQVLPRS